MNEDELQAKYQLTEQVLNDFDIWQSRNHFSKDKFYSQSDLTQLQIFTQLHNIGFNLVEIEDYLNSDKTSKLRVTQKNKLLKRKRTEKLITIHRLEKQIATIDYLKFQLTKGDL
ncbi:MerR family transcriptional regulator [Companilactobacillus baiquanensis]|uniref:HTH merR-type domain-containing protein n=1 Tax=Companilactobacillus baiquanensis TaxID=2486005 RepID=A0ABW1UYR2_9LACO|nr:hypothetical protein [Companilactobacillus baiquanensis]